MRFLMAKVDTTATYYMTSSHNITLRHKHDCPPTPAFQAMNTINVEFLNQLRTPKIRRNGRPAVYQERLWRNVTKC